MWSHDSYSLQKFTTASRVCLMHMTKAGRIVLFLNPLLPIVPYFLHLYSSKAPSLSVQTVWLCKLLVSLVLSIIKTLFLPTFTFNSYTHCHKYIYPQASAASSHFLSTILSMSKGCTTKDCSLPLTFSLGLNSTTLAFMSSIHMIYR